MDSQQQLTLDFSPAHRNTDPVTSEMAEEEITSCGTRQRQADRVYRLATQNIGCTSAELANIGGVDRYMVARRLPDLEHNGLVKNRATRKCRVSGRMAVTWWIVPNVESEN